MVSGHLSEIGTCLQDVQLRTIYSYLYDKVTFISLNSGKTDQNFLVIKHTISFSLNPNKPRVSVLPNTHGFQGPLSKEESTGHPIS